MKLERLCNAAGLKCPADQIDTEIFGVAMDSRAVVKGGLFVCIRGLHTSGASYLAEAAERGAVCAVCEPGTVEDSPIPILWTTNARAAAAYLFDAWYGFPTRRLKCIGVTGTNGKTSVTHMLKAILEADLHRCGLIGTVGCESSGRKLDAKGQNVLANMTTPDPPELYRILAEMADDGVEYVLMEVTSHALALQKTAPIDFEASIFTNLTPEHLDFHHDMSSYANAKARLFTRSRLSVIHSDSPYAGEMVAASKGRVITCGISQPSDWTAREIEEKGSGGVSYQLCTKDAQIKLSCPIPGSFTVINSMQAAICALQLGVPARAVQDALSSLGGIKGRMERVRLGLGADFTVLIDYAHTPDALENLLQAAKRLKTDSGVLTLLFGCGGDRDKSKRAMMGSVACRYADRVILTSDNSRSEDPEDILADILTGIDPQHPHTVIPDRRAAIEFAILNARSGDVILLAGKGHEQYEITREGRLPFCEAALVKRAFEMRRKQEKNTDSTEKGS